MRLARQFVAAAVFLLASGCMGPPYDPARATRPYPTDLERLEMVDIQVFREGIHLEIVNATAHSYEDVTLWLNRRFALASPPLPAGKTTRIRLWDFYDERGEVFNAGGFFRTRRPTPVRLMEIEANDGSGMIGLITNRAERRE